MDERKSSLQMLSLQKRLENAAIDERNSDDVLVIEFFDSDFSDQKSLTASIPLLQPAKKVKFILKETERNATKQAFVNFARNFLEKSIHSLEYFDISDNGSLTYKDDEEVPADRTQSARQRLVARKNFSDTIRNFFVTLFKCINLKELKLNNSYLGLEKQTDVVFQKLNNARFCCELIDLRDSFDNQKITLERLYEIVMPNSEGKLPTAKILISTKALPECLELKFNSNSHVNLIEINAEVITAYRDKIFNQKIEEIEKIPADHHPVSIEFKPPLEKLSDEEVKKLAEALQAKDCQVSRLCLPFCDLNVATVGQPAASLINAIATHCTLEEINFFKLGISADVSTALSRIVAKNEKIQRIICDYRLFLGDEFQQVVESIQNNSQSQLKIIKHGYQYIELVGGPEKGKLTAGDLENLINRIEALSNNLRNIQIVVDLSMLEDELILNLRRKCLLPFPSVNYGEYEEEKLKRLYASQLGSTQLILTPCYETHEKVMEQIRLYIKSQIVSAQSNPVEAENSPEITEDEAELKGPDDEISDSDLDDASNNVSKKKIFFTDSDLEKPIVTVKGESAVDASDPFNFDGLDENLRTKICELIIEAADNYELNKAIYVLRGKFVEEDSVNKSAEWYLYIDTMSGTEILDAIRDLQELQTIGKEAEREKAINLLKNNIQNYPDSIRKFITVNFIGINVLSENNSVDKRLNDIPELKGHARTLLLISPPEIKAFLAWAEKLRRHVGLRETMHTYRLRQAVCYGEPGIKSAEQEKLSPTIIEKSDNSEIVIVSEPVLPIDNNSSQKTTVEITEHNPSSSDSDSGSDSDSDSVITATQLKSTVTLEKLINENDCAWLDFFLIFLNQEPTEQSHGQNSISTSFTVDTNNINQKPWTQPVVEMLAILNGYIALSNQLKSDTFRQDICSILICLNGVLARLNNLQNGGNEAAVFEIPQAFAQLDTFIRHVEQKLTGTAGTENTRINIANLSSQQAKRNNYLESVESAKASILKFKIAQYSLYAIVILAVIASIGVGLFATLPYIAIPVTIALLALAASEFARQQKNDSEEKKQTNTEAQNNMPSTFSAYLDTDFKPAILPTVNNAFTFFKEAPDSTDNLAMQSVESFLNPRP